MLSSSAVASIPQDTSRVPLLRKLDNYGCAGTRRRILGFEIGPLLGDYKSLLELIPDTETICLAEPQSNERMPLTHRRLRTFVESEFDLTKFNLPPSSRVAVLLPNGPELAVTIIATVSRWCAAPINPTNTWQEIRAELQSTKARAIIIAAGASGNEAALEAVKSLPVGVIVISPIGSITGLFRLNVLIPVPSLDEAAAAGVDFSVPAPRLTGGGFISYGHPETVLLLHTSGTSGNKKCVPYSLDMIIIGVGCIISSWNLTPSDICLNMMPLFHIGGIMRNIFSPLLSGGAVITCNAFDAALFWDILGAQRFTWYYAAVILISDVLKSYFLFHIFCIYSPRCIMRF